MRQRMSMDYLLMMAQGFQESQLDQYGEEPGRRRRRHAGDAGDRQGAEGRATSRKVEPNIHAGVKYMRFMIDQYFKDEPMDDARTRASSPSPSYNAGPARIRQLRKRGGGSAGSIRTSGSTTSSASPPRRSAARR